MVNILSEMNDITIHLVNYYREWTSDTPYPVIFSQDFIFNDELVLTTLQDIIIMAL
jgi:hypothetical protein